MSHWQAGKLALKCSMAVLKRALINIMPEWANNIQEDASGNLVAKDTRWGEGQRKGFNIVISLQNKDIAFKQEGDGTWSAIYDPFELPRKLKGAGGLEGEVLQEVSAMRAKAIAHIRGYQCSERQIGDDRVIEMMVPVQQEGMRI